MSREIGRVRQVDALLAGGGGQPLRRQGGRKCDAPGCTATTREGKPFCTEHVEMHSYAQAVLQTLAERERQDDAVARKGGRAARLDALTVQEIRVHLEHNGPRTVERLVRELNVDEKTIRGYVAAMRRAGLVRMGRTKRGSDLVRLAQAKVARPVQTDRPQAESA